MDKLNFKDVNKQISLYKLTQMLNITLAFGSLIFPHIASNQITLLTHSPL